MMTATFLVQVALKTSIVLAAAWAVTSMMGRCSAAARHLVWSGAFFACLLMPAVILYVPSWSLPILPAAQERAAPVRPQQTSPLIVGSRTRMETGRELARPPDAQNTWTRASRETATALTLTLWAVVAMCGLFRLSAGLLWAAWMARRARPISDARWLLLSEQLAASLRLKSRILLRRSEQASVPLTCGIWRSVLLVPAEADRWSPDRRRVVLLHELAHVKRRDCLVRAIGRAACALYWFNPLAHVALRRLRMEQERACDDIVLAAGTTAPDYANHLLDIARASCTTLWNPAALAMATPSELEGRMLAILDDTRRRETPSRFLRMLVAGAIVAALLTVGALQLSAMNQASPRQLDPTTVALTHGLPDPPQVAAALGMRPAELAAVLRSMRDQVKSPGHDMAIREWTRIVDRETRQRIAGALAPALNDADDSVRQTANEAFAALPQSDGPVVVTSPCRGNCIGSHDDRWESLLTMWFSSDLQSPDVEIRRRAVERLPLRGASGMRLLSEALMDREPRVRTLAAIRLDSVVAPAAVPGWLSLLSDANASLRERAAISLGVIGDPGAIDALTATLLNDAEPVVRKQAARSLGYIASGGGN